jgi:hypothetical protein
MPLFLCDAPNRPCPTDQVEPEVAQGVGFDRIGQWVDPKEAKSALHVAIALGEHGGLARRIHVGRGDCVSQAQEKDSHHS